mmetsp:Transcript_23990/g.56996  ORF Transcript_23990/g.56996 Transcript_23990/m.56996 type:complete len:187 (+) Transcript_23990:44-604(+)
MAVRTDRPWSDYVAAWKLREGAKRAAMAKLAGKVAATAAAAPAAVAAGGVAARGGGDEPSRGRRPGAARKALGKRKTADAAQHATVFHESSEEGEAWSDDAWSDEDEKEKNELLPPCKYGSLCYRKGKAHHDTYSHPPKKARLSRVASQHLDDKSEAAIVKAAAEAADGGLRMRTRTLSRASTGSR